MMPWLGLSPLPTGHIRHVDLTGYLFAWKEGAPLVLRMPGSQLFYVACFKNEPDLRAFHERLHLTGWSIKQILDGPDFLSSFKDADDVAVIVDPVFTEEGRIRFVEIPSPARPPS